MRTFPMRAPAGPMLRLVLFAVLCGAGPAAILRADGPPRPPAGEFRLESGLVVDSTVHFDRNSLRDSLHLGDGLIALTTSGSLLRFELPAVRLVRERTGDAEVTCLGRGEGGEVLAGLSDGRVCRVDPETLGLADAEVAKLPAPPRWVGWGPATGDRPAGLVVVTRPTKPVVSDGRHWDVPYSVVHDLATGKAFELEEEATAFLLDRAGRVWLGADRGEWGGRVSRVDLVGGTAGAIKPPPSRDPERKAFWLGIRGFIELRDGQVWAFGGAGFNGGEIARVDVAAPRMLFAFEPPDEVGKEPDPSRPRSPIAHISEEGGGGLLVFSDNELFRVDRALSSWKKEAVFDVSDRWERAYPPVCVVHPPGRPGGPCLLATIGDGYVLLDGGKATPRGVPGQLGASVIDEIKNTSEGTLFFERSPELPPWRLGAHGWETASLAPFEPDPADGAGFEAGRESGFETRVLVGAGGMIYTVSCGGIGPETLITARRVGGKPERIGREASSLVPWASFLTADGTLWNAYNRKLSRFDEGRWRAVAPLSKGEGAFFLESLNADGPPWLLLDPSDGDLWRLEHGPRGEDPRLARVQLRDGEKALRVRDAIPWHDGALLLATDAGLRAYAPAAGTISRANLPEPARLATVLVRDGLGRLWLGGDDGLWLGEPGAKALEALGRIPGVGRGVVYGLAPDPEHADGVIAALGPRGVAFVRAARRP